MHTVAAIQMVSAPDVASNLATAARLIAQAAQQGASLILLPEYWPLMGRQDTDKVAVAEADGSGAIQDFMAQAARDHKVTLIGGTMPLASPDPAKVYNTTLVFDADGRRIARYDKIHLFGFQKGVESYEEARTIVEGQQVSTFEAPFGRVGLSVCYDLRFPELFRAMGPCALLVVPAAFTYTTGQAHWEILLRARAIENQCYVLASGQGGVHANGRRTWGHSMLIDPWGRVLDVLADGEGVIAGAIAPAVLAEVRQNLPALAHRKL
ncbi:MAG TPA: carbon-nitrogen hydrolase family protein [Burkholderiaceae bacterium]